MKYTTLFICYALSGTLQASFSFDALELQMTKSERQKTGIEKLSGDERKFIEQWLEKNEMLYHFCAPTVSDVRNIRWMYESMPIKRPSVTKQFDESMMIHGACISSLFQNKAHLLKEWLEYHKQLGVQYFYLYNHLSSDDYLDVLIPYIEMGQVELIQWPVGGTVNEQAVYTNALALAQGRAKWLIHLDVDEYLVTPQRQSLMSLLDEHDQYTTLGLQTLSNHHSFVKPHFIGRQEHRMQTKLQVRKR